MLIYRLARRCPDRVAVIDSNLKRYTYHSLNSMADAVGRMFPTEQASRVGVLTGAGIRQIASILAIIKKGGAYVPLDPALNSAALRRAAAKAGVDFVIADKENISRLGEIRAVELPEVIEYEPTDGFAPISLGRKSIACAMPSIDGSYEELSGLAVRKHARFLNEEFGITANDVVLQSSVATSPMFLAEVFATMMKGATLAILPERNRGYAKAVADFAERAGVTVICGYRPMVDELGLMHRLPSRVRMLLGVASDRLMATLSGFNKADTWRCWFAIKFGSRNLSLR